MPDNKTENTSSVKRLVILSFCFVLTEVLIGFYYYGHSVELEKNIKADVLKETEIAYRTALKSYDSIAQTAYAGMVNVPEILNEVKTAFAQEDRKVYRENVYQKLLPVYNSMTEQGILQFHFHFPDGTSFLRMHAPHKHSDQIFEKRYSLQKVRTEKAFVSGFEEGHFVDGYRNVFPLLSSGEYIGSVEIDMGMVAVTRLMETLYGNMAHFTIKRKVVEEISYPDWFEKNYAPCILSESLVVPADQRSKSFSGSSLIQKLTHKLAQRVQDTIDNMEPAVELITYSDEDYLASLLPIRNVAGMKVAYIVLFKQSSLISEHKSENFRSFIITSFLVIAVFWFFYLLVVRNEHLQQQKVALELKTHELGNALNEVKTLQGILPICSFCKKIRDDEGYWNQIENYIHARSDAQFSHSVCDKCMKEQYPEFEASRKK